MIKHYNRKSVFTELINFCHLSKPHDFLEVTNWHNGEGFDVTINDVTTQLTWGQFKALKKLLKELTK